MLDVKKLQALRDKILGVTVDPSTYGDLNSVVYLQQILDAVKGTDPLNIRGNLAEHIYLQKIVNAKRGVADGQFGSLPNSIYLQQLINAYNGVADGQFGSLPESAYLDALIAVATSGASVFTYLLRDEFTTADAAPLTSPRNCEPGPGTFTVVDTANRYSIASGRLVVSGAGNAGFVDYLKSGGTLGPTNGLTIATKVVTVTGTNRVDVQVRSSYGNDLLINMADTSVQVRDATGGFITYTASGYPYNVTIIRRAAGYFWFVNNKLIYVTNAGNVTANLIVGCPINNVGTITLEHVRVGQLGAPFNSDYGFATNRVAIPGVNEVTASEVNAVIEMTWTAVTGETWDFMVRRTDDAHNWIIRLSQGGSTIKLIENNAGETERASAAITLTNGVAYRLHVFLDGNTIKAIVNNVAKISYTTASFNNTATSVKTSKAGIDLIAWPGDLSGAALVEKNKINP